MPRHHRPSGVLRVQVISDLHTELGPLGAVSADAVATGADIVIQAGDMAKAPDAVQRSAGLFPQTAVLVNVTGNHEHYDTGLIWLASEPPYGFTATRTIAVYGETIAAHS